MTYTPEQWEWIMDRYFLEGYNPSEIARTFFVSRSTVVWHINKSGRKRNPLAEKLGEFHKIGKNQNESETDSPQNPCPSCRKKTPDGA